MSNIKYKSEYKSWYPEPYIIESEEIYLDMVESVFRVQVASGQWEPMKLTAHQAEYHKDDIAVKGHEAKSSIVTKSRNTSFTISSAIRLLTGNYLFRDEVVPLVRINEQKVKELVSEIKKIVKHMRPIRLDNGELWPFDPKKVIMTNKLEINFPDRGVLFTGYPANASSAENIRGLRITRGIIDESNFMKEYKTIYVAMRDAARGSMPDGKKYFQLTIGTTLKGLFTPFKIWLDNVKKLNLPVLKFYEWPVFDPTKFEIGRSVHDQEDLVPIVPWHSLQDLEYKRLEDQKVFLEEYMGVCTPDDMTFYPIDKILDLYLTESVNLDTPEDENGEYYMGVDPAGEGDDFFSVSIFELINGVYYQRKLFYEKNTDLEDMQEYLISLLEVWNPIKCRVDANNIGYQLGQALKKRFPEQVELIRGRVSVKGDTKLNISINEYMHTNQKRLISQKRVYYLNDDLQANHFTGWDYAFRCEHTKEYGHGDTTISNSLALLPQGWKRGDRGGDSKVQTVITTESLNEKRDFKKMDVMDRIKFYQRQHKRRIL